METKLETPKERGRRVGQYFREQDRQYGKVNGHYPSNPYWANSSDAVCYDEGYDEAFEAV